MRVLTAPCSFKESLTASAASDRMATAARALGWDVDEAPLADGGEGTLDALQRPLGLTLKTSDIEGMLGGRVSARFGIRGNLAVVEAAEALGLGLIPKAQRDPMRATSRGLGQLMKAAVDQGARTLMVGLGGSATIDGGLGMKQTFTNGQGINLTGLVDVDVPLSGARMFMRQKFSRDVGDSVLDAMTTKLVGTFPAAIAVMPGAGAAGGIGAMLLSIGGTLVSGSAVVFDTLDLEARVARADLVITGEGRIDEQTLRGKAVGALVGLCRKHRKRLIAFCGDTDFSAHGLEVVVITPPGQPLDQALAGAAHNLERSVTRILTPR